MTATAQPIPAEAPAPAVPARRDPPLTEPAILFMVIMAMMTIGILMVYSASRTVYAATDGYYFTRHLIFVPLALAALVAGSRVPYARLNRAWVAWSILILAVVLLAGVLVVGEGHGGARRWFSLHAGPVRVSFQPSEYAKFAMVLFMAWFFSRPKAQPGTLLRGFLPTITIIGIVCVLIIKEDFGTGALVGLVAVLMCLVAGWRLWYPLLLIAPGAVGFYKFVWLVPYRRTRLTTFINPWEYFNGSGWHVCQSLMAIGSGGLFGVGLGAGIQKLYIPEVTTDFIFAAVCEEMGLLGGLLVLGLFGVFIWRAGRIVKAAPDRFGFLLACGILLTIGLQAAINIGVVSSALPTKGISLPFISYGGSGLVMMSFAVGLLASVARRCRSAEELEKLSGALVYVPATRGVPVVRVARRTPETTDAMVEASAPEPAASESGGVAPVSEVPAPDASTPPVTGESATEEEPSGNA